MKPVRLGVLVVAVALLSAHQPTVRSETETIDLKALAKKARPAVMLLVVSDADGKEIATGTGFLVSSDGKLITNHHVIENAASAVAKAENGGLFPVEGVLADDPKNDLVLLKLKGKDLPFLTLGNSDEIEVGTRIAVIGSPLGLEGTLSEGIVSAVRELVGDMKVLQVTAAISPGSSGSPVMNAKGNVVGITAALLRGGQALNFAVPVECGVRLMAKVKTASVPQPFDQPLNAGGVRDIYLDPDFRAAIGAELEGDYVETLKRAKVLVARYPDNAVAWSQLCCAFANLGFTDDAIAACRQAIKIEPDDTDAWHYLGLAYGKSGRTDDAIAAYRQAINIWPYAESWLALGVLYGKSERTDDAIEAYRQAIKLQPKDPGVCVEIGVKLRWYALINTNLSLLDDAIKAYQQAIKLKPDEADTWNRLGVAYAEANRLDEAIAAYKQAVKLRPDFDAWYNLGDALSETGRTNEAAAAFQSARELNPKQFKLREDMKK